MLLTRLNYFENKNSPEFWEITDVVFGNQNLIIGLNATGKTRLVNVITNLGKILSSKIRKNGNWNLVFKKKDGTVYEYILEINKQKIDRELIRENGKTLLHRNGKKGLIYSKKDRKNHDFNPPDEELTINVRRDTSHYPYLEDFIEWAENIHGYRFSGVTKDQITVANDPGGYLETLTTIPYILNTIQENRPLISNIIDDMNQIGYPVKNVFTRAMMDPVNLHRVFFVSVQEENLRCETQQNVMSSGMFRALCLIVIIEYMIKQKQSGTIIIDDLGEGLDFDRSTRLTKLVLSKLEKSDIQLIITSNDRFLINNVDLKIINFLSRKGHIVKSINYQNSKDRFDEFLLSGLSNFDLLNTDFQF